MRYVYSPNALVSKYKGSIIICNGKDIDLHEDKLYMVNDITHDYHGGFVVIVEEVVIEK